ncbi:MAG: DUF151 domain-containing protein [Tannerella sp.]|jgi:hypothetical protein|nr:DUF151 domain-containing protein [Tannerella sp.]
MDREIKIYRTDFEINRTTDSRLVKLLDRDDRLLMIVPIDMIAVNTFFWNFAEHSDTSYDRYTEAEKERIQMSSLHSRLLDVMKMLDGEMWKTVIDDLQDGQVFATVYFTDCNDEPYSVPAEASDALALAILSSCDIYIKESMTAISKNARLHRVYWYDHDEELMAEARNASLDELVSLPPQDIKQLLETAARNEDFKFAARLKKADEAQKQNIEALTGMINQYLLENPMKFIEDMKKELGEQNLIIRYLDDESETEEN